MLKIKKIKTTEPVYDITVESTQNFYANNILVHNCSEITLQSNSNESFVCVLSSLNLLHWDEIVQTDAIETLIYFLDTVNQEFVDKTKGMKFMEAPHEFAKNQRALGMGVLGWHSLLQSKMIPFESLDAKMLNSDMWKTIRERADQASKELADLFGEPELLKGYGRRNVTTIAVAPTTSCATPETKFLDSEGLSIDYFELFKRGGLDLNSFLNIDLEMEDGSIKTLHYKTPVKIKRNEVIHIEIAATLKENDEIIEILQ
jgi:hypothetical protein